MSYSVDDLVSSLSSSHIGQEALDLAALQVQLAATLYPARASRSSTSCSSQHSNTPLGRTPSNSFGMNTDMTTAMRTTMNSRRGSYSTPHHHHHHHHHTYNHTNTYAKNESTVSSSAHLHNHGHNFISAFDDTMEEDERMVEELLLPSPNLSSNSIPTTPSFAPSHSHAHLLSPSLFSVSDPCSNSLFATTDPFYLSQLQTSQQPFAPNPAGAQSIFAQNGRISQGSRFALHSATF